MFGNHHFILHMTLATGHESSWSHILISKINASFYSFVINSSDHIPILHLDDKIVSLSINEINI